MGLQAANYQSSKAANRDLTLVLCSNRNCNLNNMSKNKLSILLIKKNTPADMIIKQKEEIHYEQIAGCGFYYKHSFTSTPKWVERFFNNQLTCSERLRTTTITS